MPQTLPVALYSFQADLERRPAHDAFYGKHFRALYQHGASSQLVGIFFQGLWILLNNFHDQVGRYDVRKKIEPE